MTNIKRVLLISAILACAPLMAQAAMSGTDDPVQDVDKLHQQRDAFARDFAQKVLAILQDPKKNYADRKTVLRQAFSNSVDIDWIARFVLGRAWNEATDSQKQRYTALYRKYLTETYVANFADDPTRRIRDIKIFGVNDGAGDADDFNVRTQMMLANFDNLTVNYLVHEKEGAYKVRDIVIENISLIESHRSEFTALASSQGIGGVISRLEHATADAQKPITLSMK